MSVAVGDIIRTTCRFKSGFSGDVVNVFHFCAVVGGGVESDSDVMDAIETLLDTAYGRLSTSLPNSLDPYDIRHEIVDWVAGKETTLRVLGTRTWVLTNPPASSGEPLPAQAAAIVNFRTTLPKTFGRKYLGPMLESSNNGGTVNSGTMTAIGNFISDILTAINMTNLTLDSGVLTYKSGTIGHFIEFAAGVINAIMGIQRRRRPNRGS